MRFTSGFDVEEKKHYIECACGARIFLDPEVPSDPHMKADEHAREVHGVIGDAQVGRQITIV